MSVWHMGTLGNCVSVPMCQTHRRCLEIKQYYQIVIGTWVYAVVIIQIRIHDHRVWYTNDTTILLEPARAVKNELHASLNPFSNPRIRYGSCKDGRHVRFTCKNGHDYRQPVSLSISLECCVCSLAALDSAHPIRCDSDRESHFFCQGCFNNMVKIQFMGVSKARFLVSQTVLSCVEFLPWSCRCVTVAQDQKPWSISAIWCCRNVRSVQSLFRILMHAPP